MSKRRPVEIAVPEAPPKRKAALWMRVSTEDQHPENQELALGAAAERAGDEVVTKYLLHGVSAYKGEHRADLARMLADAQAGQFDVLYVAALDRLDRESAIGPFLILKQLKDRGVDVVSLAEPWASMTGAFADLFALLVGWFANFESSRRSERVRAGLARRTAAGLPVGRQVGAVDKTRRRRSGYVARHERARKAKR